MLIKDEETQRRHRREETIHRTRELSVTSARGEARAAPLVRNRHESVSNRERQEGKRLTSTEFMRRLRTLNSDLLMEPHPYRHAPINADKACIYLLLPDGRKEFIMVCEADWMPEWSVMGEMTVRTPNGSPQGYWPETRIPGREIKRGWRTVLIRLLHKGLLSLPAVEREFGTGDRESWKILTGKGPGRLLI